MNDVLLDFLGYWLCLGAAFTTGLCAWATAVRYHDTRRRR